MLGDPEALEPVIPVVPVDEENRPCRCVLHLRWTPLTRGGSRRTSAKSYLRSVVRLHGDLCGNLDRVHPSAPVRMRRQRHYPLQHGPVVRIDRHHCELCDPSVQLAPNRVHCRRRLSDRQVLEMRQPWPLQHFVSEQLRELVGIVPGLRRFAGRSAGGRQIREPTRVAAGGRTPLEPAPGSRRATMRAPPPARPAR